MGKKFTAKPRRPQRFKINQKSNPAAVLVDMEIIAKAPVRFLFSGMGDALATWFEAKACHDTQSKNVRAVRSQ